MQASNTCISSSFYYLYMNHSLTCKWFPSDMKFFSDELLSQLPNWSTSTSDREVLSTLIQISCIWDSLGLFLGYCGLRSSDVHWGQHSGSLNGFLACESEALWAESGHDGGDGYNCESSCCQTNHQLDTAGKCRGSGDSYALAEISAQQASTCIPASW